MHAVRFSDEPGSIGLKRPGQEPIKSDRAKYIVACKIFKAFS